MQRQREITIKRLGVYFASVICSLNMFAASDDVSVETIKSVSKSVVPIVCAYINDDKRFQIAAIVGTGFFVNRDGRFLTVAHVFDDWEQNKTRHDCYPAVYVSDDGYAAFRDNRKVHAFSFSLASCISDAAMDLAVCQTRDNPFASPRIPKGAIEPVSFDLTYWPPGTPVAFTGFPLEFNSPITSKANIAGIMTVDNAANHLAWIIDKTAWEGASGSPVYIANGKVIGIIRSTGTEKFSGMSFSRGASLITDFLAKHQNGTQRQ